MSEQSVLKSEWPILLTLLLPIPILFFCWGSIPQIIPTHYNLHGDADAFGSKSAYLGILPIINVFIAALLYFIPRIDPKKQVTATSPGYRGLRIIVSALFLVIFTFIILAAMGKQFDIGRAIMGAVMLLFVGLGFLLPKLKPNYFAGIRLPWTLEDPENWRLTHDIGGKVSIIGGGIGFLLVMLLPSLYSIAVVVAVGISLALIPAIYSYRLFKSAGRRVS